jgi:phospholipid/cholesterol/gamma-HCH transport system substrate-binding protein
VKISKEVKVGLLAIVSGVVLYLGFNFLKGVDFLSPNNSYYAVYDDVDGLTVSNPVTLNGLAVGRVKDIRILQNRNNKLLVTLDINNDIALGDSTKAILASSGVLGGKYILLEVGPLGRILEDDDTLRTGTEQGVTEMLQAKAGPIANNLDSLVRNMNQLVQKFDAITATIDATLLSVKQTSSSLNSTIDNNQAAIRGVMGNMQTLSKTLNDSRTGIKPLMGKINNFADTLSHMQLASAVDNANRSLESLNRTLTQVNEGQGTLGKLTHNDSLYRHLTDAAADLDSLLIDLKANPKRYVHFSLFGGGNRQEKKNKK